MNAQGPALPPPGEEQHLGDVDAPAPGSAPSGGDQLHLPDQHWPQLMLMLQEGTSTGFCHCSRTGVSPKYPSVGHQTYRRSLRQLRIPPLPQAGSPVSLKKFIEGYLALPTALALSMAMLSLFLFVPAEYFTEILPSLFFWLAMMAVIIVIKKMFTTVEVAETVATDNRS